MRTEEELVQIIQAAQEDLKILRKERATHNIDSQLHTAHAAGVEEDDILGIVDILYHPENYLENDEPIAAPTMNGKLIF